MSFSVRYQHGTQRTPPGRQTPVHGFYTGYTYVTRKNRRNDPDRLTLRKFDPRVGRHVDFREER